MNDDVYNDNSLSPIVNILVTGRDCATKIIGSADDDVIVARIGNNSAFVADPQYDAVISVSGELQLSVNGCVNENFSALVIVDAVDESEQDGPCPLVNSPSGPFTPNPINLRTGNKVLSETDLTIQSPGQALTFIRSYSQDSQEDTNYQFMGLGWAHNHCYKLTLTGSAPDRVAQITLSSGGILILDEDTAGHFIARAGSTSTLDYDDTNNEYILTTSSKTTFVFDDTTPYLLKRRTWPNDEVWTYTHDGSGNLTKVEDDYGRELNFTYFSGETSGNVFKNGQLKTISDLSSPTRIVAFDYLPEKDNGATVTPHKALLSSVTDVRGKVWAYDYYGQHSGESTDALLNFLTKRLSPDIQAGTDDGVITLEELNYTLSGSIITEITQKRGSTLLETDLVFKPNSANLTEMTLDGKTTTHHFANGVYVGAADPDGNVPFQVIGDDYRPIDQADANGNQTLLTWANNGQRLTNVEDALENETEFNYNTNDTLNYSLDAQGRKTAYTYGDSNNPRQPTIVKVFDTNGTTVLRWQEFTYDSKGRTTEERLIDPADGTTILQKTARSYYSSGNGVGLLETVTQYERTSSGTFVTAAITTYIYDSADRVIKTHKTSLFGSCEFSYTVYDAADNVLATVCGSENVTIPTDVEEARDLYNADSMRVTTHEYDEMGRRIKTTINDGDPVPASAQATLTAYDALNRMIRTVANYNAASAGVANPYTAVHGSFGHGTKNNENLVTDTLYDGRGRVMQQCDALGNLMHYVYDAADRVIRTIINYVPQGSPEVDPANWIWNQTASRWEYSSGNAVNHGDNDLNIISEQEYAANGNLVKTIDPLRRVAFTVYDALNRPIKMVRNAKDEATITLNPGNTGYVAANDPRSITYLPSTDPDRDLIEETTYDAMGRVLQTQHLMENRAGVSLWNATYFVYDSLGRQIRTIQNYVAQGATDPSTWVWDAGQNRWETSTGTAIVHDSDVANGKVNDINLISTTVYDAQGRVQYPEDINRTKTYQVYDGLGRQVKTIANYVIQGSSDPADWEWDASQSRWEDGANTAISYGTQNDQNIIAETIYDGNGRVLTTRDILGRQTYNVYDINGRLSRRIANYVVQGSSDPADWEWDATDNRWEDGAGNAIDRGTHDDQNIITDTVYDDEGRVLQTIDVRRNQTYTVYDELGRRVTSISNYVEQGSSDPADWVWDATQSRWEDGANNAIDRGTNKDQNVISTTEYDLVGRVSITRDAAGNEAHYEYDDLGRRVKTIANYVNGVYTSAEPDKDLISITTYNKGGQVVETVDARGTQTHFTYDDAGRRLTVSRAADSALETTDYTCYDKAGRVLRSVRNWDGTGTPDTQDGSGNWTFSPADHGQLNDRNLITEFAYDAASRRISTTDPEGNVSETSYFKDGQVDTMTDPEGTVTAYRYDGLRRRRMVVQGYVANAQDPDLWVWDAGQTRWETSTGTAIAHGTNNDQNVIVQVAHDVAGRMTSLRDPRGNLTSYLYDQLNRRTRLTNPLTTQWNTSYEDLTNGGTRTTLAFPGLSSGGSYDVTREFDRLGRLSSLTYGSPTTTPDVVFAYDDAGNRARMSEYSGASFTSKSRETHFSYDAARRLTQVDFDTDGDNDVDETVAYEYDAGGVRTKLTLPGDLEVVYVYDARGQLVSLTDWDSQQTQFSYDNVSRHVETVRENGLRSRYEYDAGSRLRKLRHTVGYKTLAHFAFEVDKRGNRTQALECLQHPATSSDTTIAYDDSSIITKGTWADVSGFKETTQFSGKLSLGFLGQNLPVAGVPGSKVRLTIGTGNDHGIVDVYIDGSLWESFDGYAASAGERDIDITLYGEGPHTLQLRNRNARNLLSSGNKLRFKQLVIQDIAYDLRTIQYTYDALSRLIEADYGDTQYTYGFDLAGNMTNMDGATRTYNAANQMTHDGTNSLTYDANGNLTSGGYTWDRANRLISDGTVTYYYDGLGNRTARIRGLGFAQYLLDLQPGLAQVLAHTENSSTIRYVHSPRGIHAEQSNAGAWTYPIQDGLGSVRGMVNNTLGVNWTMDYDPYGNAASNFGSTETPFGFTGEQQDWVSDLIYLRARHYAPGMGTFTSLDPLETLNRYAYVNGNPINLTDPLGLSPLTALVAFCTANPAICASVLAGVGAAGYEAITFGEDRAVNTINFLSNLLGGLADGLESYLDRLATDDLLTPGSPYLGATSATGGEITFPGEAWGGVTNPDVWNPADIGGDSSVIISEICNSGLCGATLTELIRRIVRDRARPIDRSVPVPRERPNEGCEHVGYHGTSSNVMESILEAINPPSQGNFRGNQLGVGFYVTPNVPAANLFARIAVGKRGGFRVILGICAYGFSRMTYTNVPRMIGLREIWWHIPPTSHYIRDYDYLKAPIDGYEHWQQIKFNPKAYSYLRAEVAIAYPEGYTD